VTRTTDQGARLAKQSEPATRERRKGSDTRAEIRDVALELFTERGYESTSMREIAERLGISKAALYYHFESKEAIVLGLFSDYIEVMDGVLEWAESQPPSWTHSIAIVSRWLTAAADPGLRLIRFSTMNHAVIRDSGVFNREQLIGRLDRAAQLIVGPDAPVGDRLRARMALLSVHSAAMAAKDLDISDEDILSAAREVASTLVTDLVPTDRS